MTTVMALDIIRSEWQQRLREAVTVAKTKANSSSIMQVVRDCLGVLGK
jgi:hypothetical protein